ncbi:hypothetical protein [Phenylobacterium sp.]|jgi:hypothetical protein|uniref:hypothetical protein n=1 Tax=Phenylobacterium sp. TaxID=1871053 RepID=UPI002F415B8B
MFAPPPPAPPALTIQQKADLDCLDLGLTLETDVASKRRPTINLSAVFLERLRKSDPDIDWDSLAQPLPDAFTYDEFVKRMSACEARARTAPQGEAKAR